jgi:hypothetical protein
VLSEYCQREATPQVVDWPIEAFLIGQQPEKIPTKSFFGFRIGFQSLQLREE